MEENIQKAITQLKKAKIRLLLDYPFYGVLMSGIELSVVKGSQKASYNGKRLRIGCDYVLERSISELMLIFLHTLLHISLKHVERNRNRDRNTWDKACDIVVNSLLMEDVNADSSLYIGDIMLKHIAPTGHEGKEYSAEAIYDMFRKQGNNQDQEDSDSSDKEESEDNEDEENDYESEDDIDYDDEDSEDDNDYESDDDIDYDDEDSEDDNDYESDDYDDEDSDDEENDYESDDDIDYDDNDDYDEEDGESDDDDYSGDSENDDDSDMDSEIDDYEDNKDGIDSHSEWRTNDKRELEWRIRMVEAANAMQIRMDNAVGKKSFHLIPLGMERLLNRIKNPQKDWREVLKEFVEEEINDYSFSPCDRRFGEFNFFLPDFNDSEYRVRDVHFWIDTSSSMSKEEVTECFSEVYAAIEQFNGKIQGKLGFFDAKAYPLQPFENVDDLSQIIPLGGGGTDFQIIFDYTKQHYEGNLPKGIIIFTDGYAIYPMESIAMGVPVLWIINNEDVDPPWGKVIRIEHKDE